jgi:putative ABC transport system substrate-binding protein
VRHPLSLVLLALLAVAAGGVSTSAQQSGRVYRVGLLHLGKPGLVMIPVEKWSGPGGVFRDRLKDSGYVIGRNLVVEERHASGDPGRLPTEAAALVAAGVDVIFTQGTEATVAAMQTTKRIPIVFGFVSDPVEKGMVASLARPGGNVTGMAVLIAQPKAWQNLREVAPDIVRAGAVFSEFNRPAANRAEAYEALTNARMRANAAAVGLEPISMPVKSLVEIDSRFAELAAMGRAGAVVSTDATMIEQRGEVLSMALRHRLPTSCSQRRSFAEAGCLVTYTEDVPGIMRGVALQVAKVLNGAPPADIPVEQPTNYKVVINLRTAKALDLTIAPVVLAKADEIID